MPADAPRLERLLYIGVPAGTVWKALIDPEIVRQYYLCPLKQIDPRVGGKIVYGTPTTDLIRGEILELEPERKLVHSFAFILPAHGGNIEGDTPTRVSYQITPMGEMCSLRLIHDGFTELNQAFTNVSEGWDYILSPLKTLLETGKRLPWPDAV